MFTFTNVPTPEMILLSFITLKLSNEQQGIDIDIPTSNVAYFYFTDTVLLSLGSKP